MVNTDIAIIGAGPIGLELGVALKKAGVDYLHFDAGQIGQTISWFPPMTRFFSSPERIAIAGVPLQTIEQAKATREEYLAYLRAVVQQFDLQVRTYERVQRIEKMQGEFLLHTVHGGTPLEYRARRIVVAVGDMARPRRLDIPGEDLPHVSHYFDDPHRYFRQRVLIVGGRNSAAEAALRCHRAGASVSLSYRRAAFDRKAVKYWILPEVEGLIRGGHIGFHPSTVPLAITPAHVTLGRAGAETPGATPGSAFPEQDLRVEGGADGGTIQVPADFVLLLTGYVADSSLFEMLGVELQPEGRAPVCDAQTMQTSVPGVYVAGTAAAGTQQSFRVFIENCHVHVERIVRALTGKPGQGVQVREYDEPED